MFIFGCERRIVCAKVVKIRLRVSSRSGHNGYYPLIGRQRRRVEVQWSVSRLLQKSKNSNYLKDFTTATPRCPVSNIDSKVATRLHTVIPAAALRDLIDLIPRPAVFKLGSADQRGSATGSHGVRERIPKSSNCLHSF